MAFEEILYEVSDSIATVTLNRPKRLNAWTCTMDREYAAAMADADGRDDVRAVIVTGAGRGFCAGADVNLLMAVVQKEGDVPGAGFPFSEAQCEPDRGAPDEPRPPKSFPPAMSKPVIGAINGVAVGLGFVNTLYYDIRFAGESAKFSTAFARLGLIAEYGSSWTFPRLLGMSNALDLLLTGRFIDAQEALRMGLVSRVVPDDQLMDVTREYAKTLATQVSPRSLRVIKRQVYEALYMDLHQALESDRAQMFKSFESEDFIEGVGAFLSKRPPQFPGR